MPPDIRLYTLRLLALDSGYAGKYLTLDSLKESATAGRYIANLVGQTELVDTEPQSRHRQRERMRRFQ